MKTLLRFIKLDEDRWALIRSIAEQANVKSEPDRKILTEWVPFLSKVPDKLRNDTKSTLLLSEAEETTAAFGGQKPRNIGYESRAVPSQVTFK